MVAIYAAKKLFGTSVLTGKTRTAEDSAANKFGIGAIAVGVTAGDYIRMSCVQLRHRMPTFKGAD